MSASAAEVGVGREVICTDGWRVTMHVEVRRGPHCKGQILSARDLPTGCQQQCSLVVPTVRATTSDRTERQVTSKHKETYALLFGSGFSVQVMSLQHVDARAARI